MVEDLRQLTEIIRNENPTSLCFSLAQHGSFLLRQYLYKYPTVLTVPFWPEPEFMKNSLLMPGFL